MRESNSSNDSPLPMRPIDLQSDVVASLNDVLKAFVSYGPLRPPSDPTGPLRGWPIAIKDNIDIAGEVVSIGSPIYATRRATTTATAVQRLFEAGASIVGRTQMVEMAFGGWGINESLGTPRNPWDRDVPRVAGGSSSGCAVAIAAGMVPTALGGDTAGSIRMPAALCGITGLKTSFGRIPVDGVFPLAPSYDTVGPMARSAEECARLFEVLAGTSLPDKAPDRRRVIRLDPLAYPVPVAPDVQRALDEAADVFERLGVQWHKSPPPFELAQLTRDAGTLIAAEALEVHRSMFESRPEAFGKELRVRLEQARNGDPAKVAAARTARRESVQRFNDWLATDDVLLLPTVHCTAPAIDAIDEHTTPLGQFTRWVNHVGGCALSLPAGLDARGLPLAIQFVGREGSEANILALGQAFQRATDWHLRQADLSWVHAP